VPGLAARLAPEAGDRDQAIAGERPVDRVRAVGGQPRGGGRDRLRAFLLEARGEGIRMIAQPGEPQFAIDGRIVGTEPADRQVR
jgi:hypothetical protein